MIETGKVIAGKYRVDGVVGAGGMGIVLSATHLELGCAVCLKFMRPDLACDAGARERFVAEARIASSLRNEHICAIHDVATLDDGTPYIVMEHVDGRDLHAEVRSRGPLPIDEAIGLIRQTCEAMRDAHALGVVHRDLKPHNLLLTRRLDGTALVKIVDFGISRPAGEHATTAGVGSPAFTAPEQIRRHRTIDARADVYALGAALYYLITGEPPFVADTPASATVLAYTETAARASSRRADVPAWLDALIARCLDRRAERRYANAGTLLVALEQRAASAPPRWSRRITWSSAAAAALAVAAIGAGWSGSATSTTTLSSAPHADASSAATPPAAPARPLPTEPPRIASEPAAPTLVAPRRAPISARRVAPDPAMTTRPSEPAMPPAPPAPAAEIVAPAAAAPVQAAPPGGRCRTDDFLCQFGTAR